MAIKIRFDIKNNPEMPTFILAKRSGKKIGLINNISDVHVADNFNAPTDVSFKVHKIDKHIEPDEPTVLWEDIKNFRKVWVKEWDTWFTLTLGINEDSETVKDISLVPNSEFELSNVNVHNLEINTESDILREDYVEPTVFYNPYKPESSLLNRILSFTKGFVIKHVDDSLKNVQRTFSLDGSSVYDTLQEISQEFQCIIICNSGTNSDGSIERSISAYDLTSCCVDCGYRSEFTDACPKCGSKNINPPYGNDTTIFVDNEALADSLSLSTDTDSVKNCFRLLSGDGVMDAAIIATNPNGSQYIWHFTDDILEDMSSELRNKLSSYEEDYNYYENKYNVPLDTYILSSYNDVVNKYKQYKNDIEIIDNITGYASLMNNIYDVLDFKMYLETSMIPTIQTDTSAEKEAKKITEYNMPDVAVQNTTSLSSYTADNAVLSAVKVLIDNRYNVKIKTSTYDSTNLTWTGCFTVTAKNDDQDVSDSDVINIAISNDYELFCKQKIEKAIAQLNNDNYSIKGLFDLSGEDFSNRLTLYSAELLNNIYSAANAAIGIMVELGISNPSSAALVEGGVDAYNEIYKPYVEKLRYIEQEVKLRENEINKISDLYDKLIFEKHKINDYLNIEKYLGNELTIELYSYKMEDDYENSNYISEGLNNAELFKKAAEFVEVANNEIHKASEQHHSISTTLNNLLAIPEFKPLVQYFSVGNWIRIKVDKKVYKVRLLSYSIDFNDISKLQVEFSDTITSTDTSISDVFSQAQAMTKSYDSIKYQASNGDYSKKQISDWIQRGLDLTTMKILGATNQTQTWDETGITLKQWDDEIQDYTNFQSKWINTTLAFTTDNWETTETAIGRFDYYNPKTDKIEEGYGVIAKQLVGDLVLGENIGIYNNSNSFQIDNDGIIITANEDSSNNLLLIQKKNNDNTYQKYMYIDNSGNLIFEGGTLAGWNIDQNKISKESISDGITRRVLLADGTSANNNDYLQVRTGDGSQNNPYDYPFYVKSNGEAFASNLTISGGNINLVSDDSKISKLSTYYLDPSFSASFKSYITPSGSYSYRYVYDLSYNWTDCYGAYITANGIKIIHAIRPGQQVINQPNIDKVEEHPLLYLNSLISYFGCDELYFKKYDYGHDPGSYQTMASIDGDTGHANFKQLEINDLDSDRLHDFYNTIAPTYNTYDYRQYDQNTNITMRKTISINSILGQLKFFEKSGSGNMISQGFPDNMYSDGDYESLYSSNRMYIWTNADGYLVNINSNGTGNATFSGVVTASSFVNTSDRNAKDDIVEMDSMYFIKLLNLLKPVSYKYKSNIEKHYGFIAQDVQEACNELGIDASGIIIDNENGFLGLSYIELIAYLVKGWQEHEKEIKKLNDLLN